MPARSSAPVRTAGRCSSCTAGRRPPCSCSPSATGQYNSMQAQLHRRFADGLSLSVNYTLARGKSDNENSSFTPNVQALAYSSRNYALISTDRTHNVGITNSWELPFGPDRRWLTGRRRAFVYRWAGGR